MTMDAQTGAEGNKGRALPVGTDVSKDELVVGIGDVDQQRSELLAPCTNDEAGFAALAAQVEAKQHQLGLTQVHVTLEPSGGYELAFAYFAYQRGWQVSMVNPKTIRDWAKGLGQRSKTDQLDALILAQYTAERHPRLWQPPAPELEELQALLSRRSDLLHMIRAERNRQKQLGVRPHRIKTVNTNVQHVLTALENALADIETALADWRQRHPPQNEQADNLDSIPGVGPKTVLPLLAILSRWSILTAGQGSDKGLTAFVGLDPKLYQSGTSVRKRSLISKQGDSSVRATLFMAVLGALRGKNALHVFYDSLTARGKKPMVAIVACMRKLLIWAWHVFITNKPYDKAKHPLPS